MTTFWVDPASGSPSGAGTSFATRRSTISGLSGLTAGDTVRVIASPDPTSLGQTATWTNKSATVTLSSSVTRNISTCDASWNASANVTSTQDTSSYREGIASVANAIASGFTTGIVAYSVTGAVSIPAGYTQVSFWIKPSSAVAAGVLRLDVCSDTVGAVPFASVPIPALVGGVWVAVTHEFGALPATFNSVSLYAISDPGTITINLDNILLCKTNTSADSLTLSSLISKNTEGEAWWGIRSINGITVVLDNNPRMSSGGNNRGYSGVTQTVTTWKRETLKVGPASSTTTDLDLISTSGTSGNVITISGGWNQADMSTQTGQSYIDGQTAYGQYRVSGSHISMSNLFFCRQHYVQTTGSNLTLDIGASNNGDTGVYLNGGSNNSISIRNANANQSYGVQVNSSNKLTINYIKNAHSNLSYGVYFVYSSIVVTSPSTSSIQANNNVTYGLEAGGVGGTIYNVISNDNGNTGTRIVTSMPVSFLGVTATGNGFYGIAPNTNSLFSTFRAKIYNLTTASNSSGAIQYNSGVVGLNYNLYNAVMPDFGVGAAITNYSGATIYSQNEGGTANNHVIRGDGYTIQTDSSVTYSGSGYSWKVSPTSTIRDSIYPVQLVIGEVALNANKLFTFTAKVKKNHATNINAKLVIPGGQIAGIPDDVEVTAANSTSWQDLTVTATPTEGGIAIQVLLYVFSGTSTTEFVNVDGPLSISQAT